MGRGFEFLRRFYGFYWDRRGFKLRVQKISLRGLIKLSSTIYFGTFMDLAIPDRRWRDIWALFVGVLFFIVQQDNSQLFSLPSVFLVSISWSGFFLLYFL